MTQLDSQAVDEARSGKVDEARDALCEEIAYRATRAPNADALLILADAFSKAAYGPQGGRVDYAYSGDVMNRYGDVRPRGAGFGTP